MIWCPVTGLNHNAVRMQLETLLMNPGILPGMVTVSAPLLLWCRIIPVSKLVNRLIPEFW